MIAPQVLIHWSGMDPQDITWEDEVSMASNYPNSTLREKFFLKKKVLKDPKIIFKKWIQNRVTQQMDESNLL